MVKALARDLRPLLEGRVLSAGLFGSFARGEAKPGSNIDLLVIVETLKERERIGALLSDQLQSLAERYGLPLQPVIYERRRLNHGSGAQDLLEMAEQDWVQVTGVDIKQIRRTLKVAKTSTRRRIA
jgi:hypothetical protein